MMKRSSLKWLFICPLLAVTIAACTRTPPDQTGTETPPVPGTFAFDKEFLKAHKEVIELSNNNGKSKLLIIKDYQGRVMTSTADGDAGNSYGWLNYALIASGEILPHINPVGGEDRFWLGPEGGQFALYFKKGDPFDFEHWQTPALIDTEPFDLISADSVQATFTKTSSITNYAGYSFSITINRQIKMLDSDEIEREFGVPLQHLKSVSFQSINSITNSGEENWSKTTGLPSIWILGMFNPSDKTVIVLPYEKSGNPHDVTDDYFGEIPEGRIIKSDSLLLLKGDGKYRCKVGIAPSISRNIAGSYDAEKGILTLIKFDLDKSADYVNSKWEWQQQPFKGDVLNSYNDGPVNDGQQLGPFYELESSSPAHELKKGETLSHRHITLHLEGSKEDLNSVAQITLGISLDQVQSFPQ
jgi:hypothetical protein